MSELDGIPAALLALVLLVWFADWGTNDDARLIAGRSRLMAAGYGGVVTPVVRPELARPSDSPPS